MVQMCSKDQVDVIEKEADEYASQGLRTLVFGYKKIDGIPNGDNWDRVTAADVECGLTLVAVTAVEDLLQESVRQCIQDFKDAGMKVWMLTGDKGATARMIGLQCGMIS